MTNARTVVTYNQFLQCCANDPDVHFVEIRNVAPWGVPGFTFRTDCGWSEVFLNCCNLEGVGNGLFDAANEGDTLLVNTAILSDLGLTLESQDTKTTVEIVPGQLRFSVESSAFIMTEQDVEIVASGVTAISAFENHLTLYPDTIELPNLPENNSLTRIVGIDDVTNRLGYIERDSLQTGGGYGGEEYTFANGLTEAGGNVQIGGPLTENTTINGDFSLALSGTIDSSFKLSVTNTGIESQAIYAYVSGLDSVGLDVTSLGGRAINALSTATGAQAVRAENTTEGGTGIAAVGQLYGISASATDGVGIAVQATNSQGGLAIQGTVSGSIASSILPGLTLVRNFAGTAQNGLGTSNKYRIRTSTGTIQDAAEIKVSWTDVTNATRSAAFDIDLVNNAVQARKLSISGPGQLTLDAYGSGTFTGTATKLLGVTSSGVVTEENPISATNGLTYTTGAIGLGGTLTENRSIFTESFSFSFETNTSSGTSREVLVLSTPYSDNDAVTYYLSFVSPDDVLTISSFDKGMSFDYSGDPLSGGQLAFNSDSPIIFTVGEAFSVDALSLSFTVNGDSGAADQVLTADGAGNATWKYPSIDVAPYDAGNGAWVTATGTGITFAKAGGNGTFTIPGGVRLKGFRVEGQTSDLAGDNSFTLTFTGQFANTTLATIYPPIIQKYNRNDGTSPGSNAWDYDIDNTPKWSISGFNPLVIKGINMNAFSHWGLIGVWA